MRIKLQHAHYQDDPTGFYFEIQADGNHETLATSEIYNTKRAAKDAIMLIIGQASLADVVDETL
jgi:uncharacterized protein YegP (UPF0339 family)